MLRLARPTDKDLLRPVITRFHEHSPYRLMPIEWDKVDTIIDTFTTSMLDHCFILDVNEDGSVRGLLAGMTVETLLNTEKMATEVLWWVEEPYRKSRTAFELLGAFEFWAQKVGCKYVHMTRLENEDGPIVDRIYTKRNYTQMECAYLKEL
jgi:hypothetical protein